MKEKFLELNDLSAGYGKRMVIESVSLNISSGQRVGLIGPNGSGKSTLLRAIVSEIYETSGNIIFKGEDITNLETSHIIGRGVGYLRQTRNVFAGLTVKENLEIAAESGKSGAVRNLDEIFEVFSVLRGLGSSRAGLLSGGERQTLAIAMILMRRVSLLLLDEPLAGLSPSSAQELLMCVDRLQREENFAIIMVEHRLKLIQTYMDRVIIMVGGLVEKDSTGAEILGNREELERYFLA